MNDRPGLAKASPILAAIGTGLDEMESVLAAKDSAIDDLRNRLADVCAADVLALQAEVETLRPECERLTAENADLRAKLDAVIKAHNETLSRFAEIDAAVPK